MPKLIKLKVKPRKADVINPCVPELTAMLGCWAVSHDLKNTGECAQAAKNLAECMKTSSGSRKVASSTINYHLARLGKGLMR
ncbi:hypothetical protein FRC04_001047 [Tulasnella sp. 424]|nr:hypothetical protein FRC04_001047 [Tulasnella sp. 424]KAG8977955.1 hypothetical protein FRC05_000483 [Tulasnella sp. 425]